MHQLYALKRSDHNETYYCHFYPSPEQVRMCMDIKNPETIYLVQVHEKPDGSYYAWKDHEGTYSKIYRNPHQHRVCFPDGPEAETQQGRGHTVFVSVSEEGIYVSGRAP